VPQSTASPRTRVERYRETNVGSRTGPLSLIVPTEVKGQIGEREDGEEERRWIGGREEKWVEGRGEYN
jgi:hypothetical protein